MRLKRKRTPSLLDFNNDRKTEPREVTRISENRNSTKNESCGTITPSDNGLQELKNEFEKMKAEMTAMAQRLIECQPNTVLGKQKSKSKERNYVTKHIGIEQYRRIKTFKDGEDEPFKVTLLKIISFAEEYQKLEGRFKTH